MISTRHPIAVAITISPRRMVFRVAVLLAMFAAVLSVANTAGAQSVSWVEIAQRDQLITEQEALLNIYRCRFDIDTHLLAGGCVDGAPGLPAIKPQPFTGTPTAEELARRDWLVNAQEALLNDYRCRFNIDTLVVPGAAVNRHQRPPQHLRPHRLPAQPPRPAQPPQHRTRICPLPRCTRWYSPRSHLSRRRQNSAAGS